MVSFHFQNFQKFDYFFIAVRIIGTLDLSVGNMVGNYNC
jgi:hypothetical protein